MYKVKIMGIVEYYKYFCASYGEKIWQLTDSGYPTFCALGYCDHKNKEIVVCRVGKWRERALHELGHVAGLKHCSSIGQIMHPWGFCRGMDGAREIAGRLKEDYEHYLDYLR